MMNLLRITKKLQECNQYIQQLEAENKLLHENISLAGKDKQRKYEAHRKNCLRPIHEMADFIKSKYAFRHNVVRDIYEFRPLTIEGSWRPIDDRQINTIMNHVQDDGGVLCLKSSVMQRIKSTIATDYHPIKDYLDSIRGTWDGQDRVDELCSRINKSDYCRRMMHLWLRAMVAQWLGIDSRHANAVM